MGRGFLPALPIVVSRDDLLGCFKSIRKRYPGQTKGLDDFLKEVEGKCDGDVLTIPAMESMFGLELEVVLEDRKVLTDPQRDLLDKLMFAGGSKALIRNTDEDGHTLVTAVEVLPRDIAPLLILDASGRVKYTYDLWEMHRRTLRRLKSPRKRYPGLTIHHWKKGGSRTSVQAKPEPFIEAMSAVIGKELNSSSSSKWLVVTRKRKDGDRTDVWERLKASLPSEHLDRVSPITWGMHTATNAFADCTHAMLLGGLYLDREVLEAQCLAASGFYADEKMSALLKAPYVSLDVPCEDVWFQHIGEISHDLLQAACRISIRKGAEAARPSILMSR